MKRASAATRVPVCVVVGVLSAVWRVYCVVASACALRRAARGQLRRVA
jgi:hypothetical protein